MNIEELDTAELFEELIDSGDLSGDRFIGNEYYEELEYFEEEPVVLEKTDDGYWAEFKLDTNMWYHVEGGVDVHIGIENTAQKFDGRSHEITTGYLYVWFEESDDENRMYENVEAEVELENCEDVRNVSFTEPADYHDTPYDIV